MPLDAKRIKVELDALADTCQTVAEWLPRIGYPSPRIREPGFATLAQAICGQQISVAAAKAIWERFEMKLDRNVTAKRTAAFGYDALRKVGFSNRKTEYILGLSEAIETGRLDLQTLPDLSDNEAIDELVKIRGFGPWTAQIYLLFAEGRSDIWPHDDIALQEGVKTLFELTERPKGLKSNTYIEHWRPYRSVGALFTWHVYGSTTLG